MSAPGPSVAGRSKPGMAAPASTSASSKSTEDRNQAQTLEKLQEELKNAQEKIKQLEQQLKRVQNERPMETYMRELLEVPKGSPTEPEASMTFDELLDVFVTMYDESRLASRAARKSDHIEKFLNKYAPIAQHVKEKRMNKQQFEHVKVIGTGNFSMIQLVKNKESGKPYVIKRMSKQDMLEKSQSCFFRTEIEFLIQASKSAIYEGRKAPGIVALKYAFHDATDLFLVMDFYPGGDLLSLLGKHDQFNEDFARFYMSEMVVSVNTVHRMGYLHRDIKIDNFLLDARGHLYLTDFGSAIKMDANGKATEYITGGTPDYISPELLTVMQGGNVTYDTGCDWWSLGCILYEMLYGETPFFDESIIKMYHKIKSHKTSLVFGETTTPVSQAAMDLISALLTDQEKRLGRKGVQEIMNHPFFETIDWDTVRKVSKVPFKPNLVGQFDTMLFDDFEEEEEEAQNYERKGAVIRRNTSRSHTEEYKFGSLLPFVGYSFSYIGPDGDGSEGSPFIEEGVRSTYKQRRREKDKVQNEQQKKETAGAKPAEVTVEAKAKAEAEEEEEEEQGGLNMEGKYGEANAKFNQAYGGTPARKSKHKISFTDPVVWFDAANNGDLEMLKTILAKGTVKVDELHRTGATALSIVCIANVEGSIECAKFLLSKGANINHQNEDGNTPLHHAIIEEATDVAKLLLEKGARVDIENEDGATAVDLVEAKTEDYEVDPSLKAAVAVMKAKLKQ
eukprot:comp23300_c0_seq1/m.38249 comp23300_c0_seq1/g.38249  ORF comp23300_c0_seq1/g.38249 comp23300_c0_seq1/m.38249 type:complete len:733 (-) comp23300_c0_seq1:544-2742(-)